MWVLLKVFTGSTQVMECNLQLLHFGKKVIKLLLQGCCQFLPFCFDCYAGHVQHKKNVVS